MRVTVVIPPEPVVVWEEAAAHLRLLDEDQRTYVESLIAAATANIDGPDGWLGRAIGVQLMEARADVFRDCMRLPYPPLIEIESVKYLDSSSTEVTVLPSEYELRGQLMGSAFGKRWPSVSAHPEAVRIRYRAGYEVPPAPIRAAILLMVGDMFAFRETAGSGLMSAVPMSTTVETLLNPYRVFA